MAFGLSKAKLAAFMVESWCFTPMMGAPGGNNSSGNDECKPASDAARRHGLSVRLECARSRRTPKRLPAAGRVPRQRRTLPDQDDPWLVRFHLPLGREPFGRWNESLPASLFSGRRTWLAAVCGFGYGGVA